MIDTQAIRSKILDLAMHGQLTEQLPEDGTAEELYQHIQAEKQRLIKEGIIKKEKPLPDIIENESTFDIPDNWKWVRLQEITSNQTLNDGNWVLSDDMVDNGPVKLIQLGSIGDLKYKDKGFKYLTKQRFEELNGKQIYPGYLLINRLVADKMLLCIIPSIEGTLITAVDVCWVAPQKRCYDIKYLMYALSSSSIQKKVKEVGHGVTRFRISKTNLINIPFPFPPLSEQARIVNRIEYLFSILDTIDELQKQYADNLTALKSKLIDAAIQGKFTEQLPEDGTAEELYEQIQEEKQKLIKEGKIKKQKPLPEIFDEEIPFDIPDNWRWVRMEDITSKITSGSTPKGGKKSNAYVSDGFPFFREQNIYNDGIHTDGMVYISEDLLRTRLNSTVIAKDILLNITGGSIGRCALISDDFDRGSINQHILILRMVKPETRFYIHQLMCSSYVQSYIKNKAVGDKDGFSGGRCKQMLIPLPPLAEQKRIVKKLEEILPLCEKLK